MRQVRVIRLLSHTNRAMYYADGQMHMSTVVSVTKYVRVSLLVDRPCSRGCESEICPLTARVRHVGSVTYIDYPKGTKDPDNCGSRSIEIEAAVENAAKPSGQMGFLK